MVVYELSGAVMDAGTDQFGSASYTVATATSTAMTTSIVPNVDDAIFLAFWDFEDDDDTAFSYTNGYTIGDWIKSGSGSPQNSVGSGYKIITDGLFHTTTVAVDAGGADQVMGQMLVVDAAEVAGGGSTRAIGDQAARVGELLVTG